MVKEVVLKLTPNRDYSLNFDTFLKGLAYVCLYKSREVHVDDILIEDITLSFIRERKLIKLLKKLIEDHFAIEEKYPGIYYICKDGFIPIQIIVSKDLNEKNHIWLNSLKSGLEQKQAERLAHKTGELEDFDDKNYADFVWQIVSTVNQELVEKIKADKHVCEALARIMKPELEEMASEMANEMANKIVAEHVDEKAMTKTLHEDRMGR